MYLLKRVKKVTAIIKDKKVISVVFKSSHNLFAYSGFEVAPRPPTPPKELDDEDVKPTTIDLGQTAGRLCKFFYSSVYLYFLD